MARLGHATNTQIARELRKTYPAVSDTTVHRITQRLCQDGMLALAPQARDGAVRYDVTLTQHDHFGCNLCDGLANMNIPKKYYDALRKKLGSCHITGPLTVYGDCRACDDIHKGKSVGGLI
jgi:Fe2+ or Zn2+ uptake regulation protein